MKKIIILLTLIATTAIQAQSVNIWIDITDGSLIETHLEKAKEAVRILVGNKSMDQMRKLNMKLQVSKLSHNQFAKQYPIIDVKLLTNKAAKLGTGFMEDKAMKDVKFRINKALDISNFTYENSRNTAIYDNLSRFIKNKGKSDIILIFSDFEENTTKSKEPLNFGTSKIFGIISAPDGVVNMEKVYFWEQVLIPQITFSGDFTSELLQ